MPIYEFLCEGCGPFEERRSFVEAGNPGVCPDCKGAARRVYSMPNLRTMPAPLSKAMDRSERSAHEPEVVRKPDGGAWPRKKYRRGYGGHCDH